MGCTLFKTLDVPSGLVIPEQEMYLGVAESSHPFAVREAQHLFSWFSQSGTKGAISRIQFYNLCWKIDICISESLKSLFALLSRSADTIDKKLLLLLCILLGRGNFNTKFGKLITLYELQDSFPIAALVGMFRDMIYVATIVLPMACGVDHRKSFYLSKIRSAETNLLIVLGSFFYGLEPLNSSVLHNVFEKHPQLQKLCWSNGIRMFLIEEDIKVSRQKNTHEREMKTEETCCSAGKNNSYEELLKPKQTFKFALCAYCKNF